MHVLFFFSYFVFDATVTLTTVETAHVDSLVSEDIARYMY